MKTKSFSQAQGSVPGTRHVMETVIPGIRMVRPEQRRWLRVHLVAGVTTFVVLMPQEMAYGELAGFAPVVGLHAAIGAMAGNTLLGSSRRVLIGTEAPSAILVVIKAVAGCC